MTAQFFLTWMHDFLMPTRSVSLGASLKCGKCITPSLPSGPPLHLGSWNFRDVVSGHPAAAEGPGQEQT